MARLPTLGGDDGAWGAILNDFLEQAHNSDGSIKAGSITKAQLVVAVQNSLDKADAALPATDKTSIKAVVNHGAVAGTARPTGFGSVEWIGSVEPTNAVDGDTWIDTSS